MANQQATIVVKKVKKGGHGSHGGAWKIAYADFVTAMMAFFLLLWLLNSVTQEALEGLSNYFAPISVSESTSGSGGVLGGQVLSVEGAGTSQSGQLAQSMNLTPPRAGTGGDDAESMEDISEQEAREALEAVEQQQFEEAQKAISEAIESSEELKKLKDSLKIDNTPEGLQFQIIDLDNLAMFPSGSAEMYDHTRQLIAMLSKVIMTMGQELAIAGHTDSVPFLNDDGYGNWELSADRANAARRELLYNEIPEERFSRVVGKAATDPFLPEDTTHASNRRLSITLLKGTAPADVVPEEEEPTDTAAPLDVDIDNVADGLKKKDTPEPETEDRQPSRSDLSIFNNNKDLLDDDEEPWLPGLDQIKSKQLENAQ